ncbi:MAG: acetyl-CoA carboxylase carboxyltransferase subunit alpha [Planctomycetota bacterium]|nr:acetyl-CoA carboxylase carboxyltransferase subunit alpha [Planctomycetota bacterium]
MANESLAEFEKHILDLEADIRRLESDSVRLGVDLSGEIDTLRARCEQLRREIHASLTAWQRVKLARLVARPGVNDYVQLIMEDFLELHGDKAFGDDKAMVTGLARIGGVKVMVVGQRRGRTPKEIMESNFGSPHPEGYRKALGKMKLAEKLGLPIITFINTPGAYPGVGAEERGQAWAIARNLFDMSRLRVPIVAAVIGEGGSGGALAISLADRLLILENAFLSVISPEGCAAILWKDASKAPQAAEALCLTPDRLKQLGIVDEIIPEPLGGAHHDHAAAAAALKRSILKSIAELREIPVDRLLDMRYEKYRRIGEFIEAQEKAIVAAPTA